MVNPMIIFQQMMGKQQINNPMMQNALNLKKNNDINGLRQMAENICKQKGIKLEDLQNQIEQRFCK